MRLFVCDELVDDDKFVFVDVKDEDDDEPEPTEIAKQGTRAHRGIRAPQDLRVTESALDRESERGTMAMAAWLSRMSRMNSPSQDREIENDRRRHPEREPQTGNPFPDNTPLLEVCVCGGGTRLNH